MKDRTEHLYNYQKAMQEQDDGKAILDKAERTIKEKERESKDKSYSEAYANSNATRREKVLKEYKKFKNDLKTSLLESLLNGLFNDSLGNTKSIISEDTKAFNKSLVSNFINEEGVDNIIDKMRTTSLFTSEMASIIESTYNHILEGVDANDPETFKVDSEEEINFYDNIDSKDDIEDLTDIIRMRVSRATDQFIEKNIEDKMNIKDLMITTKEKIENIKTGDEDTDEQIAQESAMKMKRAVRKIEERPHNIYEQMVINLTKQIISNNDLKKKFTTESGKLNMDAIIEKADSYYTLLEMVNTLKIKDINEDYIKSIISME